MEAEPRPCSRQFPIGVALFRPGEATSPVAMAAIAVAARLAPVAGAGLMEAQEVAVPAEVRMEPEVPMGEERPPQAQAVPVPAQPAPARAVPVAVITEECLDANQAPQARARVCNDLGSIRTPTTTVFCVCPDQ